MEGNSDGSTRRISRACSAVQEKIHYLSNSKKVKSDEKVYNRHNALNKANNGIAILAEKGRQQTSCT